MSDRRTPETDAEWDRLQMIPDGGYSSKLAGAKLAFGMANWAASLERQRDEARELARELRDVLEAVMPYIVGDRIVPWKAAETALTKAKEVLS